MQQVPACDSTECYGRVTRILHWIMAILLAWQFTSALAHFLAEDSALDELLWGTHKSVGFLLMLLIVIRVLWALLNLRHRPPAISAAARVGHVVLYLLMILVPLVALMRQYGSGREFSPFGIRLMPGFDESLKIKWMTDLGSNFHSLLGYVLLVLALGHIAFAIKHYFAGERHITNRMLK